MQLDGTSRQDLDIRYLQGACNLAMLNEYVTALRTNEDTKRIQPHELTRNSLIYLCQYCKLQDYELQILRKEVHDKIVTERHLHNEKFLT